MIRSIEFTLKGDHNTLIICRDQGSSKAQLSFVNYNGMTFAMFDFADLKKAVEVLSAADDE